MKLIGFFALDVRQLEGGQVELTRKFLDGIGQFARSWPGEVVAVMSPRTGADSNLDHVVVHPRELPFQLVLLDPRTPSVIEVLRDASMVLLAAEYRQIGVAHLCKELGVPYAIVTEYNLKTRLQIAAVEEPRLKKRAKRVVWEIAQEAQQRRMVANAAGIQCNGTPTFDAWGPLNRDPLLFFDSRVSPAMLATAHDVARKGTQRTLELAYSGRLLAMKGGMHLVDVAAHLKARGVPFRMRIWGGGDLAVPLQARLREERVDDVVSLEGVIPCAELTEEVRTSVDLFVCPHVQGDPACTYLETLSCGVPIAGFDNDAWRGLASKSEAGWTAPMNDAKALADVIAKVAGDRERLRLTAAQALRFASDHTFEATFARRIDHLKRLARPARPAVNTVSG